VKARAVKGLDPAAPLRPNAALIVRTRLEELRSLAERALAPDAAEAQHDTRIAAKRLRYVLEIVGPCLGDAAESARQAAKEIQTILGDLHDCDVMLPKVEHVESLTAALRARRERLHREFVELWQLEASRSTWVALDSASRSSSRPPSE
jgi:CHAD domain-containing protein